MLPSTLASTTAYAASILATSFTLLTSAHAHAHDRSLLSRPLATLRPRQANPAMTYQACYSSSAGLTDQGSFEYQTSSYCQNICVKQNQAVLGLSAGSDCWCGDTLPPASSGGIGFYSIFLSGTESSVPNAGASASSSSDSSTSTSGASTSTSQPSSTSTPSTTATPSVVTSVAPGQTVIVTQPASEASSSPASSTPTPQPQPHTTNVAGIAAGVVIGVVAVAALIGALVFWLKRRKQRAAEDEYKRSTQVSAFMRGGGGGVAGGEPKPPATAYSNMSDSRLDPTAGNRNSAGSIADAEDYSRRILRVANPDGS
ncbi:Protein SLG1 [Friedmanniomyces endolithicus]|uniref:Protein SLG1 n=1 Tax=Friedmanniomyces endolithicus TaxID=329885 RepID=A0AAN6FCR4_9PEZI|nr:WSC domain [Friedmanniomyces endolithicus]KAK0299682.1 WSC domain [Friedmanniomyces endolithicus]KAK0313062.1 WSC domain [Friedmanniomyces endolithicus]KAK0826094.1 Protein SLG1 [Friedmanniomyces endolithicus]KAK0895915.1 Protein SLG1 [Friedmanniomyces endolithicus]